MNMSNFHPPEVVGRGSGTSFSPTEVVSRYLDPRLQVGENYSYL